MGKAVIRTVLRVMLPLGSDAASSDAQEKAYQIVCKVVEAEFNSNTARWMLKDLLARTNYKPIPGTEGTLRDLRTNEPLNLAVNTAVHLVFGHWQWKQQQVQSILDMWPAQEFYRAEWRENPRNWPERWKAAGGRFFPGKSSYPEGRMIALKDDAIWTTISAFGLPFCPFDFTSGMDVRDVGRNEALELGVLKVNHSIQPAALSASDEFQERLATKVNESFAKFQVDEERRLSDPLNFGNGNDLLRLAEEKIEESEHLSSEQIREIVSFVEKAIEKGVANNPDGLLAEGTPYAALLAGIGQCRSLAFIFGVINETRHAMFYGQSCAEIAGKLSSPSCRSLPSDG